MPDAFTSPQGRGITKMNTVELTIEEYQRLMDAILWILGPFLDDDQIGEHPHLFELAECYNELYHKMPKNWEHDYPQLPIHSQETHKKSLLGTF